MDELVKSKPMRGTTALVEQLHEEIRKKNDTILELEKRYNRLVELLEQFK